VFEVQEGLRRTEETQRFEGLPWWPAPPPCKNATRPACFEARFKEREIANFQSQLHLERPSIKSASSPCRFDKG
jgi:hypothetical protein